MTYTEIFQEIVSIMKEDSATCKDFGAGDYQVFQSKISDDMERLEFLHVVKEYLATFGLEGHLNFSDETLGSIGLSVMRHDDELYVTKANPDTGLVPGDRIIAVDSTSITAIAQKESRLLMEESVERQGILWPDVLAFYQKVTVLHQDNTIEDVSIIHDSKGENKAGHFFKEYQDNTIYLRLSDFVDLNAINQLYTDCKNALDNCNRLIIDVRGNGGGADSAFVPLLEYCFPEGKEITDYYKPEYPIEINYSMRNCKDRIQLLKKCLATIFLRTWLRCLIKW